MVRLCRWLLPVMVLLACGAGTLRASSAANAYDTAEKAFHLGSWAYADKRFGEFVQKYPRSPQVPSAILFQARAKYQLNHFSEAISLLATNRTRAGIWEDEYLFWMAQAHFKNHDFGAAADVFGSLGERFPDSPRRLEALVGQATAIAQTRDWPRVISLLDNPGGVFQKTAKAAPDDEFVFRGYLLLVEAQLSRTNYEAAQNALEFLGKRSADTQLLWRREYLRCNLDLARGQRHDALDNTTRLLALAGGPQPPPLGTNVAPFDLYGNNSVPPPVVPDLLATSWTFRAEILESLNNPVDAIAAYTNNLAPGVPVDQQRRALFKISSLNMAQGDYNAAAKILDDFLKTLGESAASDMALLTLGELELRLALPDTTNSTRATAGVAISNLLTHAQARFDSLLAQYPGSALIGKALLDKGWCLWTAGQYTNGDAAVRLYAQSEDAFRRATETLRSADDQAVARFKWADAQFMQHRFVAASTNYQFVVTHFSDLPYAREHLLERALYQLVLVSLPFDLATATDAMSKLLLWYPGGFDGPKCLVLVGEGKATHNDADGARQLFADFERRYPSSPLLPDIQLAVARSYEHETNWDKAIDKYTEWISRFPTNEDLARAEFLRAWDNYMAGRETNALTLFTNFVARFPTNELARQAQFWIGDYYFRQGANQKAEENYIPVFNNPNATNWQPSSLTYLAQLMAGRAALARLGYKDAITYFTNLAGNAACPLDLRLQASFASGDVLMARTDSGATNRASDLLEAISWFNSIPQSYPRHPLAPLALGQIGNCYLQLGDTDPKYYEKATNAYYQVIESPQARFAARSLARMGLGLVAEALAKSRTGTDRTALLQQAFDYYQDVFLYRDTLRDGEEPDMFWVKKAANDAARVAEQLHDWDAAVNIYRELQDWLPQMRTTLEKKILNAQRNATGEP